MSLILRVLGKIIIFDICDHPIKIKHQIGFFLMANLASLVSFDTNKRLFYYRKKIFNKKKLFVISDPYDYEPNKKILLIKKKYNLKKNFLWFGNYENLNSIKDFINIINNNNKYNLYIVSSCRKKIKKNIIYLNWKKNFIFNISKKIDYSVLSHKFDEQSICKSENKMILSILAGIVPIVSNTPAYSILAKKLKAKNLIFNSVHEIIGISNKITPRWKKKFIDESRKYIFLNYSSGVAFNKIIKKIAEHKKK